MQLVLSPHNCVASLPSFICRRCLFACRADQSPSVVCFMIVWPRAINHLPLVFALVSNVCANFLLIMRCSDCLLLVVCCNLHRGLCVQRAVRFLPSFALVFHNRLLFVSDKVNWSQHMFPCLCSFVDTSGDALCVTSFDTLVVCHSLSHRRRCLCCNCGAALCSVI